MSENERTPLFMQLVESIKKQIKSGVIKTGERLPSERMLAQNAGVSRNTAKLALEKLELEGLITIKPQAGAFVTSWEKAAPKKSVNWEKIFLRGKSVATGQDEFKSSVDTVLNVSARRPSGRGGFLRHFFYEISAPNTDLEQIYTDEARSPLGSFSLREAIANHAKKYGINATPDQVCLFSSTRQVFSVIKEAFLGVGVDFFYEKASYIHLNGADAVNLSNNIRLPLDNEGIVLHGEKSQSIFSKKAILHFQPYNHFPTGITISQKRQNEVLKTFCSNRIPVIELASMIEIYAEAVPPPPLKSMDKNNSVIYVGSLARVTGADISIAWAIADEYVINNFAVIRMQNDLYLSPFMQLLAELAIRSGFFDEYTKRLRRNLIRKRDTYNEIMSKYFKDIATWNETQSSYYIYPEFEVNTSSLLSKCKGVMFLPSKYFDPDDTRHISICTQSLRPEQFEKAALEIKRAAIALLKHTE